MTCHSVSTSGDLIIRKLSVTIGSKVTCLPFLCGFLHVGHLNTPLTPTLRRLHERLWFTVYFPPRIIGEMQRFDKKKKMASQKADVMYGVESKWVKYHKFQIIKPVKG